MRNQKFNHHNTEQEQTFVENISPEDTEHIVELVDDIEVDEGQGQEVPQPSQPTSASEQLASLPVEKGLLFYIAEDGTIGYQIIGQDVSLENLTFFNAYLNRIVDEYWSNTETL